MCVGEMCACAYMGVWVFVCMCTHARVHVHLDAHTLYQLPVENCTCVLRLKFP